MFNWFMTTLRMSQSAATIEAVVLKHGWDRAAWGDPGADANRMVAAIQDQQPDLLAGRKGARPHRLALAAAGLANAAVNTRFRDKQLCLKLALGSVLLEITGKPSAHLLGQNDQLLLGIAAQVYAEMS